jgi:hypothetical protein
VSVRVGMEATGYSRWFDGYSQIGLALLDDVAPPDVYFGACGNQL